MQGQNLFPVCIQIIIVNYTLLLSVRSNRATPAVLLGSGPSWYNKRISNIFRPAKAVEVEMPCCTENERAGEDRRQPVGRQRGEQDVASSPPGKLLIFVMLIQRQTMTDQAIVTVQIRWTQLNRKF